MNEVAFNSIPIPFMAQITNIERHLSLSSLSSYVYLFALIFSQWLFFLYIVETKITTSKITHNISFRIVVCWNHFRYQIVYFGYFKNLFVHFMDMQMDTCFKNRIYKYMYFFTYIWYFDINMFLFRYRI